MNPLSIVSVCLCLSVVAGASTNLGHGYVQHPASRAYLCKTKANKNCGKIEWEPQSIEGLKNFPKGGPPDGKIASGAVAAFQQLDQFGAGRWSSPRVKFNKVDNAHVSLDMHWTLTAPHKTSGFRVFLSNANYAENKPLSRAVFHAQPSCAQSLNGQMPTKVFKHTCRFQKQQLDAMTKRPGVMLAIWDIHDTANAFYQVIDFIAQY